LHGWFPDQPAARDGLPDLVPAYNVTLELKDAAVIYDAALLGAGTGTANLSSR